VSVAAIAWMSELLVGSIEEAARTLGMSDLFVGVVVIAIIGNAAEHFSAVMMAARNDMDAALAITLGSSNQIALFVAPVLVFASYAIAPRPLELSFGRAEIGALFLAVLTGTIVSGDGQSNWFKGVQLVTVYAIIALMFYFLPELKH